MFVDPLVDRRRSPARPVTASLGPIIGGAQPVRDAVTKALLEQDCGNATYITVADIVLGGVSGAGQIGLELGGVQATTAEINAFQFALPPALPPLAAAAAPDRPPSTPRRRRRRRRRAARHRRRGGRTSPTAVAAAPVAALTGERGGLMALIAGGGLLTLLVTAEGDRRKMRSAQRAIPLEA